MAQTADRVVSVGVTERAAAETRDLEQRAERRAVARFARGREQRVGAGVAAEPKPRVVRQP
jgi:hypothetical protein